MTRRDAAETAYFTLLRAREELQALQRYDEYLADERRRLRRFTAEGAALADTVDPRVRRGMRQVDTVLADAIRARIAWIDDERRHLPERQAAAEAFVAECEAEHARHAGNA
ncbi:MAG: hypothetical protein WD377_06305 [Nitriliruptoraceae bacterium]